MTAEGPDFAEEIARGLREIEAKYSPKEPRNAPKKDAKMPHAVRQNLRLLSKEFECLGLGALTTADKTPVEILDDVATTSRILARAHKNAFDAARDAKIASDTDRERLQAKLASNEAASERLRADLARVRRAKAASDARIDGFERQAKAQKLEIERLGRAKRLQCERLESEVARLNRTSGGDRKPDEAEVVYKETIRSLQDNNRALLEEVLNLRMQLNKNY